MLRIVSGKYKNTILEVPDSARPMTDRVKTSVFDIISSRLVDARVLDVFAGSGAVGLECLSRGASYVDFIELTSMGCNMIRNNLKKCKLTYKEGKVTKGEAFKLLFKMIHGDNNNLMSYDIVFITPPHAIVSDEYIRLAAKLVKKGGLLVAECPAKATLKERNDDIYVERIEHYGKTDIYFYLTIDK